ncbi:phosphoethanolamine transferase [Helicobacter bizzozeronii]|uniref:phosphoethanolamine transferase n=1 Tax=Helicobacter bizzozeronii TaxID=56877 RepID=UPI000CF14282|nr:phosphoethanolamine transferase [Helicobacter bizzozeronii]
MVLDNRFWLCWLAPVVASFFSVEVQVWGEAFWHVLKVAFYSFLVFYVFYLLLSLIPHQALAKFLTNTMLVISLVLTFIDFFASYYFHMGFTPSLVGTLLATNTSESQEFLRGMVLPHMGFILGYWATCAVFLFCVRFKLSLSPKQSLKTLATLFVLFWAHTLGAFYGQGGRGFLINPNILTRIMPLAKEVYALVASLHEYSQIKTIYASLKQSYPKDYLKADSNSVDNVVLIVGESASKNFMGVYGYPVPNTPFLSDLQERGQNLFVFKNTISAFASTLPTFQTLLNYSDVENHTIPWYRQRDLGGVFKLAGYQTFWIDNQESMAASNLYNALAYNFDHKYFTDTPYKAILSHHDQWVIPIFTQQVQPKLGAKNLILFHLFGSHSVYNRRFPKSFAKFHIKDIPYQGLHVQDDKDKQIIADYVNSLYYTDHVLEGIFKLFENKDAIIFYLSDHAQDMFESANTYGHRCSAYGVEIPFVIYVTDIFKQKHPEKVKAIAGAVDKPFMSDDLIHSLLPLVGIHTKDNLESKNLFSPAFDTHRKRIYCGDRLYEGKPSRAKN